MSEITNNKAYEWKLVIIFFFCWGFIFLDRLAIVFLTPTLIEVFTMTNAQVGLISTVTTGCYAVAIIVFGILATKIKKPKRMLLIFVFATAIAALICAFVQTYTQLLVIRGIIGALEGPISPLILLIVSKAASDKSFGLDVGIINLGVCMIAITFGAIAVTKMLNFLDWQMAFLIVSLPSFIVGALVLFTTNEVLIEAAPAAGTNSNDRKGSVGELLKYRNVPLAAIVSVLAFSGYWGIMIFAPVYLTQINLVSIETMGRIMSVMGIMTMIYAVVIPKLSDIFGRKPVLSIAICVPLIGAFIMGMAPGTTLSLAAYIIIGGILGTAGPIAWNIIPMESVPDYLKASSCGIILGLGEIIGGAVFPYVGGKIADAWGLPTMMIVIGCLLIGSLVFSLFIKETLPAKVKARDTQPNTVADIA